MSIIDKYKAKLRQEVKERNDGVTCPTCKGKGEQTINTSETSEATGGVKADTGSFTMTCAVCEGKKIISYDYFIYLRDFWCECKHRNWDQTEFFDDGEHPHCHKHHYRCTKCNRVTQIG